MENCFKVGDIVEITKSKLNWGYGMDKFVGKKVVITQIYSYKGGTIKFDGSGTWEWDFDDGHFKLVTSSEPQYEIY